MAITTYGELKTAMANWLNRADLEQRIPEFIALATATLNKVIRDTRMATTANITASTGVRYASVPSDMLEPIFVTDGTDEDATLEQVSVQQLTWLRKRMSARGVVRFYAIVGRRIEFCPTPTAGATLEMSYYQAITALSADGDANWVLTYHPDIYLYTALLHSAPFLKDEEKTALFSNLVSQSIQAAVQQQTTVQFDSKGAGVTLNAPADVK